MQLIIIITSSIFVICSITIAVVNIITLLPQVNLFPSTCPSRVTYSRESESDQTCSVSAEVQTKSSTPTQPPACD